MWRSYLRRSITMASTTQRRGHQQSTMMLFTTSSNDEKGEEKRLLASEKGEAEVASKKLMMVDNGADVQALRMKLEEGGKEVIKYSELLNTCQSMGVVRSVDEAVLLAKELDHAGVVLLHWDKVYLHPDKVVKLMRKSLPLSLTPSDGDPRREELQRMQERKEEIDREAQRQARLMLWSGLGVAVMHLGVFVRLTYWEYSWDVVEPFTVFTAAFGLVIGYGYFMISSKDPTYQDQERSLFLSRQRKLFKKYEFDVGRYKELVEKCKNPLERKNI